MRAAFYTSQGPADSVLRIGEQPMPVPHEGEVRVRLKTSGVNPSDVKSRAGFSGPLAFPLIIPHSDGAGDVEMLGTGVPLERLGQRVWIWNGQWRRPFGTAAEFIVVPSAQAVPLPDGVDYAAGACLGIPAMTAWQAVHLANLGTGSTILVNGGAGSVSHYAIQLARLRGARVLATVSSQTKAAHAQAAGASEVIDYHKENVAARIREITNGHGVDAVIEVDFAGNAGLLPDILRPHGIVVVYGITGSDVNIPARWMVRNTITIRFFLVYDLKADDRTSAIKEVTELLKTNELTNAVGARFPLNQIARAHEATENKKRIGNIIIDI